MAAILLVAVSAIIAMFALLTGRGALREKEPVLGLLAALMAVLAAAGLWVAVLHPFSTI